MLGGPSAVACAGGFLFSLAVEIWVDSWDKGSGTLSMSTGNSSLSVPLPHSGHQPNCATIPPGGCQQPAYDGDCCRYDTTQW